MAKFQTKAERVRYAIRKKYISEEDYTNKEIAEELDVAEPVVSNYINHTPQAKEVQRARNAVEEEQLQQLLTDLMQRIDRLAELERQLWDVVEPVVTAYELVPAEAELGDMTLQQGGNAVQLKMDEDDRPQTEVQIPVPSQWKEVPEFSRLKSVWEERRRTEEQLSNLLGLDADENIHIDSDITERKVFSVNDDYPDSEPHPIDEPIEVESQVDDNDDHNEESNNDPNNEKSESDGSIGDNGSNTGPKGNGSNKGSMGDTHSESESSLDGSTPSNGEDDG